MAKYSLYSHSIKKFETEQLSAVEDSELRKRLMQLTANSDAESEDSLFKELTEKATKRYLRDQELDFLLEGITANFFD